MKRNSYANGYLSEPFYYDNRIVHASKSYESCQTFSITDSKNWFVL